MMQTIMQAKIRALPEKNIVVICNTSIFDVPYLFQWYRAINVKIAHRMKSTPVMSMRVVDPRDTENPSLPKRLTVSITFVLYTIFCEYQVIAKSVGLVCTRE